MTRLAPRARARRLSVLVFGALALPLVPAWVAGQVEAEPVLAGRVMRGDSAYSAATVVLHHMGGQGATELDSMRTTRDGSFVFALPTVPNQALGELYFASVRHEGVMYFGVAIETAVQLDSLYLIQAYDTLLAPAEGVEVALEARNLFLEPSGELWQATDVFQLRNDRQRTVVARPDGRVWSYPLPEGALDVMTGEGEFAPGAVTYENGEFVVRTALPPGERLFVVRYMLDSPAVTIPSPGRTELFDLLVREPAPPLVVDAMQQIESVDLEVGQTFRRYAAENVSVPFVRITIGETAEPPPVEWIAVVLALVLTGGALLALRSRGPRPAAARAEDRRAVLVQLAQLDEAFEQKGASSPAAKREYQRRRAELMQRLKSDA